MSNWKIGDKEKLMTKYRVTHEGHQMGSNTIVGSVGGIIDAVMAALKHGGTATVGEITGETPTPQESIGHGRD